MTKYFNISEEKRKQIKGALFGRGLTHSSLSIALGFSRQHITMVLNGKSAASFETWKELAHFAQVEFSAEDVEGYSICHVCQKPTTEDEGNYCDECTQELAREAN